MENALKPNIQFYRNVRRRMIQITEINTLPLNNKNRFGKNLYFFIDQYNCQIR